MFVRLVGNILQEFILEGGGGVFTPNVGRYVPRQNEKLGGGGGSGRSSGKLIVKMWVCGTDCSVGRVWLAGRRPRSATEEWKMKGSGASLSGSGVKVLGSGLSSQSSAE